MPVAAAGHLLIIDQCKFYKLWGAQCHLKFPYLTRRHASTYTSLVEIKFLTLQIENGILAHLTCVEGKQFFLQTTTCQVMISIITLQVSCTHVKLSPEQE